MRRPLLAIAIVVASGCSIILPTGNYLDPPSTGKDAGANDADTDVGATPPAADAAEAGACGRHMAPPVGYDASQIVFEDAFCGTTLDTKKWQSFIPGFDDNGHFKPPRSGPNAGSFESQYYDPSQVEVGDGLRLRAEPDGAEADAGYTAKSGVLTARQTVPAGGPNGHTYLQVRAKAPAKNGMWPKIHLDPLPGASAVPILLFAMGFADAVTPLTTFASNVGNASLYIDTGKDLTSAFYDYGVEIVWGQSVTWFWSAVGETPKQVRQALASTATIPPSASGETLFLELAVVNGKNGSSDWHTVWNGTDADVFTIAEVQIYAK